MNKGYTYRIPPPGAMIENGELMANSEYPGLVIRYTLDGSEPSVTSTEYRSPVKVTGPVKLRSFDLAGKASKTVDVTAKDN